MAEAVGDGAVVDAEGLGGELGGGEDVGGGLGEDFFEAGDDVEAELVADDIGFCVGGVVDEGLALLAQPLLYVGAGEAEQRTDNIVPSRLYALKAAQTGAPQEVHQDGLHVVVAVMGHADGLCPEVVAQLLKPLIAEVAGRHLYTDVVEAGIVAGIEMGQVEGHIPRTTEVGNEGLVAVALFATKVEVAVHGLHPVVQALEHEQEAHAVGAAAEGYEVEGIST